MWPWVPKKLLKWEKAKNILFHSKLIFSTFCEKVNFLTAPERSCRCCGQFDIGITICVWWVATPLNKSGKGHKIFWQCWTTYPSDEFQTNWIFYAEHRKHKHHFYRVADTIKVMFLFFCFSIEEPICLKFVRCFCCYSASTKTSFGFCSCSELLQLKFGRKKIGREIQIAKPPR